MKNCHSCGREIDHQASVCQYCGNEVIDSGQKITSKALPLSEQETHTTQDEEPTESRKYLIITYVPVVLGALFIFWFMSPGLATPDLDQTFRAYVLIAYGIGVVIVRKFIKTSNEFVSGILMLFGGFGCGAVVFFAFLMLYASIS